MSRSLAVVVGCALVAFLGAFGIARALSGSGGSGNATTPPAPKIARATAGHPAIAAVPATSVPALRHVHHHRAAPKKATPVAPAPAQTTPAPSTSSPTPAPTPAKPAPSKPAPTPTPTPFE